MARKPSASPQVRAAIEAARELTKQISQDEQRVNRVATAMRETFETYRNSANADLPHGIRITRLDVDLDYGINYQDPATMIERNEGVRTNARDLANGALHIAINGAPPQIINLTLFVISGEGDKKQELCMMVGNRDGDISDPHMFILEVADNNPASFTAIHEAKGERMSAIQRSEPISLLDFIGHKLEAMAVNKRTPALIAQEKLAA